mmetsp:Transcript_16319/g.42038  ORF Transcript_16319/g.42038 Transcript_16319/m.42038 type:complete len:87 (-) Transcript_16319:153-413(-)
MRFIRPLRRIAPSQIRNAPLLRDVSYRRNFSAMGGIAQSYVGAALHVDDVTERRIFAMEWRRFAGSRFDAVPLLSDIARWRTFASR